MKKIFCLVFALIMILGTSVSVFAEEYHGSNEWLASFNGTKIDSNFASEQLADDMVNVQPGDSITFTVKLQNDFKDETYWYMTNKVLQTLEESNQSAQGGAYTYILTYIDSDGKETVLYSSEVVGGEDSTSPDEGLHQATASLKDYFYLDTLDASETGTIRLFVEIEGESTGTDYQETLAKLQMSFAVEKVKSGSTIVQTGDNSNIVLYSVILLVSGLALLVLVGYKNAKKRHEQEGVQQK